MLREVRVHGIYYQPMSFQHYPFDSFDLLLELRFFGKQQVNHFVHAGVLPGQ